MKITISTKHQSVRPNVILHEQNIMQIIVSCQQASTYVYIKASSIITPKWDNYDSLTPFVAKINVSRPSGRFISLREEVL
jgi:hypothetical protein